MSLCVTQERRRYTPYCVVCFDLDGLLIDLLDHTFNECTTLSGEVHALTDAESVSSFVLDCALTSFDFFDQRVDGRHVGVADSLESGCVNHDQSLSCRCYNYNIDAYQKM